MLKRTRAIVVVTVCLVIVAVLISVAFFDNPIHPVSTPPLHLLVDENFTADADSYKAYNFTTPTDISQCQVSDSFSVSGANPNEIRVYIWTTPNSQTSKVDISPNPNPHLAKL